MNKYSLHLDINATIEVDVLAPNVEIAIQQTISDVYSDEVISPLVNIAKCTVLDEFGNVMKEYLYDRPNLDECVTTEDGKLIRLNQPKLKYYE